MKTTHKIYFEDSKKMRVIPSSSVHVAVTSCFYCQIDCALQLSADQVGRVEVIRKTGGADTP